MSPAAHASYQIYLLRCWRSDPSPAAGAWRFSLVDARTGGRRGFASFDVLVAFLREQVETGSASSDEEAAP
ncbi:MAG: hypothetical protein DCC55_12285 [Chloroflexi bacterium]|nr:MAG: hypothetical protein DCC55_12285 [Chloroflexota bacterium]